jgi:hypothetical protein
MKRVEGKGKKERGKRERRDDDAEEITKKGRSRWKANGTVHTKEQ